MNLDFGYILTHFIEKYSIPTVLKLEQAGAEGKGVALTYDGVLFEAMSFGNGWVLGVSLLFCALIGYFLGSINFAVVLSKVFHKDDVRTHGSGNAGATNMLRTYGAKAGVLTLVLDGVKAAVSVFVSMLLMGTGGAYIAGLFCILGHIFPIYHKFRGGKGVVVAAVTILVLEPVIFLCLILIFISIVYFSKYISLGSIICAFFFPLLKDAFVQKQGGIEAIITVLIAAIIIIMHKENIKRLMNRTENKFSFSKKKDVK